MTDQTLAGKARPRGGHGGGVPLTFLISWYFLPETTVIWLGKNRHYQGSVPGDPSAGGILYG